MKTFALFGIGKAGTPKLLTVVRSASLDAAASALGGSLGEREIAADNNWFLHHFEHGAVCAMFTAGICTPEVIAKAVDASGLNAETLEQHLRYSLRNTYNCLVIGQVSILE